MSISQLQYNQKKEDFKRQLLRAGVEPNNYELNSMLSAYFQDRTLGMPYYSPIKQKPYEASDKEAYNHNFKTLKEDLDIMYKAGIESNNKAVAMREYYDLETNKIRNAITRLALRVDSVAEVMDSNVLAKQYVQAFDDYYDIEYYGNSVRNIPYTTAFVDLLQKKVYTEKANTKLNKLKLSNVKISMKQLTKFNSTEVEGDLTNILSDTIDATYTFVGRSNEQSEKTIEITIDMEALMDLNTVTFAFTSSRDVKCSLSLSEDGDNFISVHDIIGKNNAEWNFPEKSIRYIKITCTKMEPDGYELSSSSKDIYEYYFILKNISIALESFEEKSVFVTKRIEFGDLVNSIKLDAMDMIYNNTRIDYFIGFDNGVSKIGWDKIDNHKEHQLFMFQKVHKILNYSVDRFAEMDPGANRLYQVYELPSSANQNSVKVTPAYNMWDVKRYRKASGVAEDPTFSFNTMDFSEYTSKCIKDTLFMDCENYHHFIMEPNVLYVFTQYVSLEQPYNLYNKFVRVTNANESQAIVAAEQKIFVNGIEVTPTGNNLYSFALRKGVNKIQMAIYSPSVGTSSRVLSHNLNFKEATDDVFGFPPMKYVNCSVLDYQMAENYNYYTIKNNKILVKMNPNDMIKSELDDMGYFISYYSLREDMANYFNSNKLAFRIMAVLNSNDPNVSPEILNFKITGK